MTRNSSEAKQNFSQLPKIVMSSTEYDIPVKLDKHLNRLLIFPERNTLLKSRIRLPSIWFLYNCLYCVLFCFSPYRSYWISRSISAILSKCHQVCKYLPLNAMDNQLNCCTQKLPDEPARLPGQQRLQELDAQSRPDSHQSWGGRGSCLQHYSSTAALAGAVRAGYGAGATGDESAEGDASCQQETLQIHAAGHGSRCSSIY